MADPVALGRRTDLLVVTIGAIVASLVVVPSLVDAQELSGNATTTLFGVVVDSESGNTIPSAVVSIPSRSMAALTREDGSFVLSSVPSGVHVIRVRQLGYEDLLRTVTVGEASVELELRLTRDPIVIEGLEVAVDGALTLSGTIVDGGSGTPMEGVYVWLSGEDRGNLSGEDGSFRLDEVPTGPQLIQVEHVGYGRQYIPVLVRPPWRPIDIVLQPDPVVLAGLPVVAKRLRARRNAHLSIVRTFDSERLAEMEVEDVRLVVRNYTFTNVIPCQGSAMAHWCVDVGGRPVEPKVCLDGELMWGGIDVLQEYRPHEIYLLEVYGTEGLTIRAYTYAHMESLARSDGTFIGEDPSTQREGIDGLGWSSGGQPAPSYLGRC